jgi:hypothetical protein
MYKERVKVHNEVNDFEKYITSMHERCWAVIQAGGGATKW